MPRKNPLPDQELRICSRLAEFRGAHKLTRAHVARAVGLNRFTLASIEAGLAPVRFELAWRYKEQFNLSLVWLFKGIGDLTGNWSISKACVPTPEMLFSRAYEFYIGQALIDARAGLKEFPHLEILAATKDKGAQLSKLDLDLIFERVKDRIPKRIWPQFTSSMELCAAEAAIDVKRILLTDSETVSKSRAVKLQLPGLLERLKKATVEPGAKTALAEFLSSVLKTSVPLASVSRWLSGEREPGGEVALLLLKWVELQERQAK